MKYFIDTEFDFTVTNDGATVIPVSVGIVAEDGREYYAVNAFAVDDNNWWHFGEFFHSDVIRALKADQYNTVYLYTMSEEIKSFVGDEEPEFWGDYAAFDYVVLATIMDGFDHWPKGWPMYINDCQQTGGVRPGASEVPHNALSDARAVRDAYMAIEND